MCAPSPPTPPDPAKTIAAQTASNLQTANSNAELNRVNTSTPWGSLNYSTDGTNADGTPKYSSALTLSPSEQQKFDLAQQGNIALGNTAQGMLGNVKDSYSQPFSLGGAPALQSSVQQDGGTTANAIKQAQDAAYKSQTQYLDPEYARAQPALENKLANQGITDTGSEAYKNAMNNFNEGKNQAYGAARNSATAAGMQEQNTLFGQGATNANINNSARNQYLAQLIAQRNQPLNEYNALMTGNQVSQPVFPGTPSVNMAGTDVGGITNQGYQNQLGAYNAAQAGSNNMMSGLFGLGGSAISSAPFMAMLSDRRAKENIWLIGHTPAGLGVYEFTYKGSDILQVGVMADEVEKVIPEAVFTDPNGYQRVRYDMVR